MKNRTEFIVGIFVILLFVFVIILTSCTLMKEKEFSETSGSSILETGSIENDSVSESDILMFAKQKMDALE